MSAPIQYRAKGFYFVIYSKGMRAFAYVVDDYGDLVLVQVQVGGNFKRVTA